MIVDVGNESSCSNGSAWTISPTIHNYLLLLCTVSWYKKNHASPFSGTQKRNMRTDWSHFIEKVIWSFCLLIVIVYDLFSLSIWKHLQLFNDHLRLKEYMGSFCDYLMVICDRLRLCGLVLRPDFKKTRVSALITEHSNIFTLYVMKGFFFCFCLLSC